MRNGAIFILLMLMASFANAAVEFVETPNDSFVFAGKDRQIEVCFRNTENSDLTAQISTRLYQASSSTLAPIGELRVWKSLHVNGSQRIIETASFDFPDVRAVTEFQIRWLDGAKELGKTLVQVSPTNLLQEITALTSNKVVGVFDPENHLGPVLKEANVKFRKVDSDLEDFRGSLALFGPFTDDENIPQTVSAFAKTKHPVTIVWMQHFSARLPKVPNFYLVELGRARVAVVDASLVADLAHSALAQINLLRCIRTAQHPEKLKLPTQQQPQP
jgi:hypothetical protein